MCWFLWLFLRFLVRIAGLMWLLNRFMFLDGFLWVLVLVMAWIFLGVNRLNSFWFFYWGNSTSWLMRGFRFEINLMMALSLRFSFLRLFFSSFLNFFNRFIAFRNDHRRFLNWVLFAAANYTYSAFLPLFIISILLINSRLAVFLWEFAFVYKIRFFLWNLMLLF